MFERILVPRDGSALAEQALAPAGRIADRLGGKLLLLRVVTPDRSLPSLQHLAVRTHGEPAAARALMDEAAAYLTGLRLPTLAGPVRTRVQCGAAPELIIATAAENGADLIVMSTHGRAGLLRRRYGSVAEAVLRGATMPVLLVPSRVTVRLETDSPSWAAQLHAAKSVSLTQA